MTTRKKNALDDTYRLEPEDLRWTCDPAQFDFVSTDEIKECPITIIGQSRAMEALRLGLAVRDRGYNIFVVGEVGTGRTTTVRAQLAQADRSGAVPDDLCYVHNFADSDQPRLMAFPAGQGCAFARAMKGMVEGLRKSLPDLFGSDVYRRRRAATVEGAKESHKEKLRAFEKRVEEDGFTLVQPQGAELGRPMLIPVVAGNAIDMNQLEGLVEEGKFELNELEALKSRHGELLVEFDGLAGEVLELQRVLRHELLDLDRSQAKPLIEEAIAEVRDAFPADRVKGYLADVASHILDNIDHFRVAQDPEIAGAERDRVKAELQKWGLPYTVNVIVDNSRAELRPILWETAPGYRNLFGTIERVQEGRGEWRTDHTRVKAGSLLRANGGFLVLDALDVLVEKGVWTALKRTLRTGRLEIQSVDTMMLMGALALQPQSIPLDVTVILIGTRQIYRMLHAKDEDFRKIFKVKADFALDSPLNADELKNYTCFIHNKCLDGDLPPFHREAVAAVVEYGVRLSGEKEKLTTRFAEVADVVREAGYWAKQARSKRVEAKHVQHALRQRRRRHDLPEEILRSRITDGAVLLDLGGEKVGQVNGLAVLNTGDHAFGSPARITAVTAVGRSGIIDIEREASMSGSIHTKGMLILSGFLRSRFAQDRPLALSASICFEQSYGGIDGDSASCAELYVLLSSLSGVPIRQGISVTGSVNQMGEVQPIGGVNEKVEGYFNLCRERGLRGRMGVLIPRRNVANLMLRKGVVDAVRKKNFHIWAIDTIEEGIQVLTGLPAGARGRTGRYPEGSVFGRVDARLAELVEAVRRYEPAPGEPGR